MTQTNGLLNQFVEHTEKMEKNVIQTTSAKSPTFAGISQGRNAMKTKSAAWRHTLKIKEQSLDGGKKTRLPLKPLLKSILKMESTVSQVWHSKMKKMKPFARKQMLLSSTM